ncbi:MULTISPECIES: hypothetical protein [pseudomallei group]|uniref:hypothetical protein n=1 Tax=pseudomallei group TaxID=111527 RepID=UPI00050F34A2|nr:MULTISPECIES: hypothetical protein [pseudomallei group]KGD33963.1 hypothetical protein DO72_1327 [Burkholderia pseudomallei]MCS6494603.1 hypothetical protein [Burkholderia thailandensis]MCS6502590.1 hypothetical protein [Burkholderia thailandensis]MCS6508660.1 hypothetical protein [Burkholderia thailandensis]MCS6512111.1 hypothetical protein [Burkholderia thailandensis]
MTTDDRIDAITQANTYAELRQAMDGYFDEAVQQYPRLAGCAPLQICLASGVYTHAVQDLQDFAGKTGESFPDAQRVLVAAYGAHVRFGGQVPADLPRRQH